MRPAEYEHCDVRFFYEPVEDLNETKAQGRPIFRDVEMIEIRRPGERLNVHVAPANDQSSYTDRATRRRFTYAELFSAEYAAFRSIGNDRLLHGTPLSEAVFLTAARRRELEAVNIRTVEALASLDGQVLSRLGMSGREMKNAAVAFLEKAQAGAAAVRDSEARREMESRISELEALLQRSLTAQASPAAVEDYDETASPFANWDDADVIAWIVDNGGAKPHHRLSRSKLLALADEMNEKLRLAAEKSEAA